MLLCLLEIFVCLTVYLSALLVCLCSVVTSCLPLQRRAAGNPSAMCVCFSDCCQSTPPPRPPNCGLRRSCWLPLLSALMPPEQKVCLTASLYLTSVYRISLCRCISFLSYDLPCLLRVDYQDVLHATAMTHYCVMLVWLSCSVYGCLISWPFTFPVRMPGCVLYLYGFLTESVAFLVAWLGPVL